uniref:Uncharacterized protein n=1 Tax=Cacopsylla melanoneura TaxID=428564 RepID=A0A8D9E084_9HEMI
MCASSLNCHRSILLILSTLTNRLGPYLFYSLRIFFIMSSFAEFRMILIYKRTIHKNSIILSINPTHFVVNSITNRLGPISSTPCGSSLLCPPLLTFVCNTRI